MFSLSEVKYRGILDIDSLDIQGGSVTCIVGESGSGKTTLLRLLNNLISCDKGEIFYNGKPISTINPVELRRNVVMLSQSPAVFGGTVRDNLLIGLKFSEKTIPDDNRLHEVLDMVQLNKDLNQDAEKLSGGEKQRLALARVILMDPPVFLLDEPSSALDEETELLVIQKLVNHVKEKNKTLIMVTHSKRIAQTFSDNIIEIRKGKVVK